MDSRTEIKRNIDNTREHISLVVDEISNVFHSRMDWKQKVRDNPAGFLLGAAAAGFLLSSMSNPIGRRLLHFGAKSAFAALGAYASKQGINYLTNKVKSA